MDLRSLKLHLVDRRVRLVLAGAGGERGCDLSDEKFERVMAAAAPILAAVETRLGGACHLSLRAISIDPVARVLRVSYEGGADPAAKFSGADYDALTRSFGELARAAVNEARPRPAPLPGSPSDPAFWDHVYRVGRDGFELGRATPPLERWFAGRDLGGRRALVVGCGRGHEARLLARLGARVVAIDFAGEALVEARALAAHEGVTVDFRQGDLFALPREPARYERYDLVLEHCCFCAIDPARRSEYVEAMASVLVDGGELVGLFWSHGRPGGPPFTVSREELVRTFSTRFSVDELQTPPDSVALRQGQELLGRFARLMDGRL